MKKMSVTQMKRIGKIDITNYNSEQREDLKNKEKSFEKLGYGTNLYGLSRLCIKGNETGTIYIILARSASLFYFG